MRESEEFPRKEARHLNMNEVRRPLMEIQLNHYDPLNSDESHAAGLTFGESDESSDIVPDIDTEPL